MPKDDRTLDDAIEMMDWITGDSPPDLAHWNPGDWMNLHRQVSRIPSLEARIAELENDHARMMLHEAVSRLTDAEMERDALAKQVEELEKKCRAPEPSSI